VKLQWAGCRETISLSGQGGAFFLTFLPRNKLRIAPLL
jgi:hypothetical protein